MSTEVNSEVMYLRQWHSATTQEAEVPALQGLDNELQILAICNLLPTCGSQQLPPVSCSIHISMYGDVVGPS